MYNKSDAGRANSMRTSYGNVMAAHTAAAGEEATNKVPYGGIPQCTSHDVNPTSGKVHVGQKVSITQ